jgi:hypothetical protein
LLASTSVLDSLCCDSSFRVCAFRVCTPSFHEQRQIFTLACLSSLAHTFFSASLKMTTSCSYDFRSLSSLRSQAILPLHYSSAVELNLWLPSAIKNARGHTQPFPFASYVDGIGTITTTYINEIADMSWDTPAEGSWDATEAQPELSSVAEDKTTPTIGDADVIATDEPSGELTGETTLDAASPSAASPTSEMRKSSLADLANGDRGAISAHLVSGLGPHKFLTRFTSQKSDAQHTDVVTNGHAEHTDAVTNGHAAHTASSEPDGAASVVDDSTSNVLTSAAVIQNESFQIAPDIPASNLLTGTTPTGSVADDVESSAQSPHLSPRSVRKLGPHHRLKALALAQDVPLPQSPAPIAKSSTSDEGPTTPITSTIEIEPAIIQDSPSAPPNTVEDGNESDVSSLAYEAFKTELLDSLSDNEVDFESNAQNPTLNPEAIDYLPPSRSASPIVQAKHTVHDSEVECINDCCPVPRGWSVPNKVIGAFAEGHLFDSPMLGGIPEKVLMYYSNFFTTAFRDDLNEKKEELDHVINDPSFTLFRRWVYGRKLVKSLDDAVSLVDKNIDLKTLVQLWRFGARIQAPLFANTVANAIVAKTITADDIAGAADDIDAVLEVVSVNNTFRLLICHAVILSGIQLNQGHGKTWPQSLLWSILGCLDMGKCTSAAIQMQSKIRPCMYHLHPLGDVCSTSK